MKESRNLPIISVFLAVVLILIIPIEAVARPMQLGDSRRDIMDSIHMGESQGEEEQEQEQEQEDRATTPVLGQSSSVVTRGTLPESAIKFTAIQILVNDQLVGPNNPMDANDQVTVTYAWNIPEGATVQLGDTYEFSLPKAFRISSGIQDKVIEDVDTRLEIARLSLSQQGKVTIRFTNEDFLKADKRIGFFYFVLHLTEEVQQGPGKQDIDLGWDIEQTIHLNNPKIKGAIEKSGEASGGFNDRQIMWTIDLNQNYESLENVMIRDDLPPTLSLESFIDVEIYPLEVRLDGSKEVDLHALRPGNDFKLKYFDDTDNHLEITFLNPISQPYRIVLHTRIKTAGLQESSITNKAILTGTNTSKNQEVEVEASGTVQNTWHIGDLISKKGYFDNLNSRIIWEVRFNYAQSRVYSEFTDTLVEDPNQTASWSYDPTSFEVKAVTPTSSTTETIDLENPIFDLKMGPDNKSFTIKMGDIDTPNVISYLVTYRTIPDDPANITGGTIKNKVISKDGHEDEGAVWVNPVYRDPGKNKTSTIVPKERNIHWNVDFNTRGEVLKEGVITDTLPLGKGVYDIDISSIRIQNRNTQKVLQEDIDYTVTYTKTAKEEIFVIAFTHDLTGIHTLTYTSKYDFTEHSPAMATPRPTYYENLLDLKWKGKDPNISDTQYYRQDIPQLLVNQGTKFGEQNRENFEARELKWTIHINSNYYSIEELILKDQMGPGQTFQPNTLTVLEADGLTPVPTNEYTLTSFTNDSFELSFAGTVTREYIIQYKTVWSGVIQPDGRYDNKVMTEGKYSDDVGVEQQYKETYEGTAYVDDGANFATKKGTQNVSNPRLIDWEIVINPHLSTIPNAVLHDRLSRPHRFKRGTFYLYEGVHGQYGGITKGALVPDTDYTLTILAPTTGEGEGFELAFVNTLETISKTYILEYQQEIIDENGQIAQVVKNKAWMSGSEVSGNHTEQEIPVDLDAGGGGGEGTLLDVTVGGTIWLDSNKNGLLETGEPRLSGITVSLTNQDGTPVTDIYHQTVAPIKTDSKGEYRFPYLPALALGETYVTSISPQEMETLFPDYVPTLEKQGNDPSINSATWTDFTDKLTQKGQKDLTLHYGFKERDTTVPPISKVSVGGTVWLDSNQNGLLEATEPRLAGVAVILTDTNGNAVQDIEGQMVDPITTGTDGTYRFEKLSPLQPGERYVTRVDEHLFHNTYPNYEPTLEKIGADPTINSATWSDFTTLVQQDGDTDLNLHYGFKTTPPVQPGGPETVAVGGVVWLDVNGDGLYQPTEPVLSGVRLLLTDGAGNPVYDVQGKQVEAIVTNDSGRYAFEELPPLVTDTYQYTRYVTVIDQAHFKTLYPDYVPTKAGVGEDPSINSADWTDGTNSVIANGQRDFTLNYGFVKKGNPVPPKPDPKPPAPNPDPQPSTPHVPERDGSGSSIPDKSWNSPPHTTPQNPIAPGPIPPPPTLNSPTQGTFPPVDEHGNPVTGGLYRSYGAQLQAKKQAELDEYPTWYAYLPLFSSIVLWFAILFLIPHKKQD